MTNTIIPAKVEAGEAQTFDAWAIKEGLISESHGVRFVNSQCDTARKAWDAALSASHPASEPPKVEAGGLSREKIIHIADQTFARFSDSHINDEWFVSFAHSIISAAQAKGSES